MNRDVGAMAASPDQEVFKYSANGLEVEKDKKQDLTPFPRFHFLDRHAVPVYFPNVPNGTGVDPA